MKLTSPVSQTSTEDNLLTVEEVAARLQVKKSWVYSNAGCLGVVRLGKYLRFVWSTVLARLGAGECIKAGAVEPAVARNHNKGR